MPGKSHGQRSLEGYSPWGHKTVGHDLVTKPQQQMCFLGDKVGQGNLDKAKSGRKSKRWEGQGSGRAGSRCQGWDWTELLGPKMWVFTLGNSETEMPSSPG